MIRITWGILSLVLTGGAISGGPADPQTVLSKILADPTRAEPAFVALRATGDKHILPLLTALARSGDRNRRRFAVAALAEIAPAEATGALLERAKSDDDKSVRVEAMARLLATEALDDDHLPDLLRSADEEIRCMIADAMVRRGRGHAALHAAAGCYGSRGSGISYPAIRA